MKISTWNVNSIVTIRQYHPWCEKSNFGQILDALDCDIFCFQETKLAREKLTREYAIPDGYDTYFSFCSMRKGYSGVATYVKKTCPLRPKRVICGLSESISSGLEDPDYLTKDDLAAFDREGRCLVSDHGEFVLFNVYCPNETSTERLPFKMNFYMALEFRVQQLLSLGRHIIIAGDINACRAEIDCADFSKSCKSFSVSSFSDHPARMWLSKLTADEAGLMVDLYRKFHPEEKGAYTCWNTLTNARPANYGARIDYILCDRELATKFTECTVDQAVLGSDHCPVTAHFLIENEDFKPETSDPPPPLCARYYDEFSGKQRTLTSYFTKAPKSSEQKTELSKSIQPSRKLEKPKTLVDYFPVVSTKSKEASGEPPLPVAKNTSEVPTKQGNKDNKNSWESILMGPPKPPPLCHHGEPSKEYTVSKKGPNTGRKFYLCQRPNNGDDGKKLTEFRCDFFQWKDQQLPTATKRSAATLDT